MSARGKAIGRDVDLLHADGSLKEARISSTNVKETQFIHARGELDLRRLTQRNWMQPVVVLEPLSFLGCTVAWNILRHNLLLSGFRLVVGLRMSIVT
ncbi:hypothetical protein LWI28_024095 [Acer negundo]|uniref:Uncharacterized protein n=1 Tax=Acer negundo TaxID=4023 RepID=A0AAD5J106_ACENE|nr:hypothetical protein LWI28_024095 [Acer negundo]